MLLEPMLRLGKVRGKLGESINKSFVVQCMNKKVLLMYIAVQLNISL